MIEPSEMNMSALNPTVRRRPVPVVSAGPSAVVDMGLPDHDVATVGARGGAEHTRFRGMVRTSGPTRDSDKPRETMIIFA
jgi:hypothetical protein